MVGKGIVFLQRFASRVTIGSRADYSRENNPRAGGTVRHFAEELDGLCIHTHNIACPFAAGPAMSGCQAGSATRIELLRPHNSDKSAEGYFVPIRLRAIRRIRSLRWRA